MTKQILPNQKSLDVEDYMDRLESDEEKSNDSTGNNKDVTLRNKIETNIDTPMRKAPTMIIELVHVGRPLKTLSLITNFGVSIFFFLSICGSNWILTANFRVGLWEECVKDFNFSMEVACNRNPCYRDYVHVFVVSCTLGLVLSIISIVILSYAMKDTHLKRKSKMYNIVIGLHIMEAILFMISLIGYPISFIKDTTVIQRSHAHGEMWGIGWSYVVGWLGVISIGVSTGLLYFDKDSEEIIFYEKISRNSCPNCV